MTRQEFLEELRKALQGQINQGRINEHIRYYDNYIMEESRKGKSEQQVIEELGNPRLIAKTLIDTTEKFGNPVDESSERSDHRQREQSIKRVKVNSWYGKILMIGLVIVVLIFVLNVALFLLPIVLPVILVLFIISYIRGRHR